MADTDKDGLHPWPPTNLLEQIGITREEWDDMQASTLPRVHAIEVMFKKAARRRTNSV